MTTDIWMPLVSELDHWQRAGRIADFWLRDDDAVEPTPALARLLELTTRHAVPVTLAVIPQHTGAALAASLNSAPLANVAVHGWSHRNFAGQGEKKQELGAHRPAETVRAELKAGLAHLQALHGSRFIPVLVPPWNRIAGSLIPELPGLGFAALSVFGMEKPAPLPMINSHVDLMDWHGSRGARDPGALIADIVNRLRQMFDGGGRMGFLSHHLVHDLSGWDFLDGLLACTLAHPACRWRALADMLAEGR